MSLRWGTDSEDILVYANPTVPQVIAAMERAATKTSSAYSYKGFYLRGICVENKKLMIWDGWKATHDDAMHEFFPEIEPHHSEYTSFEVSGTGVEVIRQGDYDLRQCRYFQNITTALSTL